MGSTTAKMYVLVVFASGNAYLPANFFFACDYGLCPPKNPPDEGAFFSAIVL
jgi:hypothetical protein